MRINASFRGWIVLVFVAAAVRPCGALAPASRSVVHVFDLAAASPPTSGTAKDRAAAWAIAHAVATLQGNANREEARLFVRFVASSESGFRGNLDDYWFERMRRKGQWLAGRRVERIGSLEELVRTYRSCIKGAVVYDPAVPATSNVASSIAGAEQLVAVRYDTMPGSVYDRLVRNGPRLPVRVRLIRPDGKPLFTGRGRIPDLDRPSTGSAKCDAYLWAKAGYLDTGRCDGTFLGYYPDAYWITARHGEPLANHLLANHDYFVARRAFFCDLHVWGDEAPQDDPGQPEGTDRRIFQEILLAAYRHGGDRSMIHIGGFTPWTHKYTKHTGGKHDPVPTEWETVRLVSAYNGYLDADAPGLGAMANASFVSHYPLRARYPQKPWPTTSDLQARGLVDADGRAIIENRQYCMVYVGDYDSAAWLYHRIPDLWDHPARGKVPLAWAISPVLERRASMALAYLRETASANDHFVAADNGAGYLNPGMVQAPREISGLPDGLDAWANHCTPLYARWDITITGFVIDGYAPGMNRQALAAYRRFSPNGLVAQKIPPALLYDGMPVIRADHDLPQQSPAAAARHACERIRARELPFHWFRTVLCAPDFFGALYAEMSRLDSRVRPLDPPTFFELLRRYLREHPGISEASIQQVAGSSGAG